jgi:hypothetical protein
MRTLVGVVVAEPWPRPPDFPSYRLSSSLPCPRASPSFHLVLDLERRAGGARPATDIGEEASE